jgi:hypothetical protein
MYVSISIQVSSVIEDEVVEFKKAENSFDFDDFESKNN